MNDGAWHHWDKRRGFLLTLICLPFIFHLMMRAPAEPVFNGDANRHVMTSVFFHDFLIDHPVQDAKNYAERYYEQYPALGLLIWPPLFHAVTGAIMLVAGLSVWVPRAVVFSSTMASVWLMVRMARRRGFADEALAAGVLFAVLPLSFTYSRVVMLEMPTVCLGLWSIERFDNWLHGGRTGTLYVAAIAAALASLTRFDGAVLLPTLLLIAAFSGRLKQLFCWHTVAATATAAILTGPVYFVIWNEMGDLHVRQATESVSGEAGQFLAPGAWAFYPSCLPEQAGWLVVGLAIVGVPFAFQAKWRSLSKVFAAIWLGTYLMFTPLAELVSRHAIYWLPAVSWFAVVGTLSIAQSMVRLSATAANTPQVLSSRKALAVIGCIMLAGSQLFAIPDQHVQGYRQAAFMALGMTRPGQTVFLDAWWEGNFIYQFRLADSKRQRSVVRANRLLYDFTSVPTVDLKAYVETDSEILDALSNLAPACIVFEGPQPFGDIPMAKQLRALIFKHPRAFAQVACIPVNVSFPGARDFSLHVFKVNLEEIEQLLSKSPSIDLMTEDEHSATATESIVDNHRDFSESR